MLKVIELLKEIFDCEISELNMNINRDTVHHVKHKYREKIIVPINAITNNIEFLMCKGEKTIFTADNVECIVENWKEVHVCELEKEIKEVYNMTAWDFIKRWHANDEFTHSMDLIVLEIKKK